MTALPAVGTRVAVPTERLADGAHGVTRLTIAGYTVAGLGSVTYTAACTWQAHDTERHTPAARVWAILTDGHGRPMGQRRADTLDPLVDLARELDALELAVTRDLAELDAIG